MRALPSLLVLLGISGPASAETYVEPSVESRALVGLALSAGTLGDGALSISGAGIELETGFAFENGASIVGTFGETRHARDDALSLPLGVTDVRAIDDAIGLRARWAVPRLELAPFVQGALFGDRVRYDGAREGSALGVSASIGAGLAWRVAPWELALAIDARRTWLEAPFADVDAIVATRWAASFGARLDW